MTSSEVADAHRPGLPPRRWVAVSVVALVSSLVAIGFSAWAVFRPGQTPPGDAGYTAGQRADAKAAICTAADMVNRGITLNTNLQGPPGDVVGSLAVQANARLSLSDGGLYLLARLEPATPTDLADAVRTLAITLVDIGAGATAGAQNTDPAQAALLQNAAAQNTRVVELCR